MVFASNDDIDRILAQIDLRDPLGVRDFCALTIARHTGLRVSELVSLDVYDVAVGREVRRSLYVRSETAKFGRARRVPLNSAARESVARLLAFNARRGFSTEPKAPLLSSKKHGRMTIRAVQRLVAELRERARLAARITPHSFRGNFATNLASASNIRITQRALGHRRLDTVAIYTFPSNEEMAAAVERLVDRGGTHV